MVSETESLMLRILEGLQRDSAEMKRDSAEMKRDISETKRDISEMRDEMQVGFAATLRQNDRRFLDHEGRLRALEEGK